MSWLADRSPRLVRFAARHFGRVVTSRKRSAPVHIVAVGRSDVATQVFNLTVEEAHLFYANGVLSSNTNMEDHAADSARYACMSRPWLKSKPEKVAPKDGYDVPSEEIDSGSSVKLL
jgi:hypothetical protein